MKTQFVKQCVVAIIAAVSLFGSSYRGAAQPCDLVLPPSPDNELFASLLAFPNGNYGSNTYSLFRVTAVAPTSVIPLGPYDGWCVDALTDIDNGNFTGELWSTCDPNLINYVAPRTNVMVPPAVWKMVNYIINHRTGYYFWDVQIAIWNLVGGPPPPPGGGYPQVHPAAVTALLTDATNNAPNWTPQCGDKIGAVWDISWTPDLQLVMIELPAPCCTNSNPPTLTVPPDEDLGCNPLLLPTDESVKQASFATNECCGATIVVSHVDTFSGCNVTRTFTVTATDDCDPFTTTKTVVYTWKVDMTPPVLMGLPPASEAYQCIGAVPNAPTVTAMDDCDGSLTVNYDQIMSGDPCDKTITRTWSAVDLCGNPVSFTQTITVKDTTKPVLTIPDDLTVECDQVPGIGSASATDNCDLDPLVQFLDEVRVDGDCTNSYKLIRTWKATDACGNMATKSQTITVEDTTAPQLTVPSDEIVQCDAVPPVGTPSATDNCDTNVLITYLGETRQDGNCAGNYVLTRTWKAQDACTNVVIKSQTITVVDTTPPVITCAPNKTVECSDPWSFDPPGATDNCSGATITVISTVTNAAACGYTVTRTWEAEDGCGNKAPCSQTVTVVDTTKPVITCAPNKTVECNQPWDFDAPSVSDNCGTPGITIVSTVTNSSACDFTVTRTWKATDSCGNMSTCSQTVTVQGCAPCIPATFSFHGSSATDGPDGNIRTFTTNGISVKVSAFSRASDGTWASAYLGQYGGGLGVTDSGEGSGGNNSHTVDNLDRLNLVLFEFSHSVVLNRAHLGYVVSDSDLTAWIGTFADPFNNHMALSDAVLGNFSYSEDNLIDNANTRWADLNAGEVAGNAIVIAALVSDTTPEDQFKIGLMDLCKRICEPLSLVCMSATTGQVDVAYSSPLVASGGTPPYMFSIISGSLPPGLSLDPDTGAITGIPTTAGSFNFTAQVEDSLGATATTGPDGCTITIGPPCEEICVPVAFNFEGSTATDGPDGNIRTFTDNGVSVKVSAFSRASDGTWAAAYLGQYGGGLGVTDSGEGSGGNNSHTVDNIDRLNFVLFEFSQPVVLNSATLGYVVSDSDLTAWIGNFGDPYNNHMSLSDAVLGSFGFTEDNLIDNANTRTADLNAGEVVGNAIVIAAWPGDATPEDQFKIKLLNLCAPVCAPPPPPCTGSICGSVFRDCDANGGIDGESGLGGWTVTLKTEGGSIVDTEITGANGSYCFEGLAGGNYYVVVTKPSNYDQTYDPDGTQDSKTLVALDDCENEAGVNFAYAGNAPAVHLVKTGPATAKCGDTITYTFAVTNTGNTCLFGGMRVVDNMLGGEIWHRTPVAPGEGFVFTKTYVVKATDPNPLSNTATVYGDPPGGLPIVSKQSTWNVQLQAGGPGSIWSTPANCKVTLNWSACAGASSYKVKRSETKGGPYVIIKTGLTTPSYTNSGLINGKAYYYVVCAVVNAAETTSSPEESAVPTGGLLAPWKTKDIGSVADVGGAGYASSKFTVVGSGNDIWNTADEFRYVYQSASGDCTVVARVVSVQGTDPWAKAGVMIRETLNNNAKHASTFVTPNNGIAFQWRNSTGGSSGNVNNTEFTAPYWVKIKRTGSTFTSYRSPNGSDWTQIGSQSVTMGSSVYIGLGVTSHNDGTLCTAVFDNVTATP